MPKEPYIWDYKIKVKTKEGTYVSEYPDEEVIDKVPAKVKVKVKRKEVQYGPTKRKNNE